VKASTEIVVAPDPGGVARATAERFVMAARRGIGLTGRARVALSGGKTPRDAYALLASRELRRQVDWARVEVFFSDERAVPPEHAESNFRMAWETLLARVPIPRERVHRMEAERADLDAAAAEYEALLRRACEAPAPEIPRLDLVLLGMGADGHTASLLPGSPALEESRRLVVPAVAPDGTRRLTFTLPLLNGADEVVFLAHGPEKAPALRRLLANDASLPASRVRPAHGHLVWIVDSALASSAGLESSSSHLGPVGT
jgi:6-phosphogluconolactonase